MHNAHAVRDLLMKARGLDATGARKLYRRALNEALPTGKLEARYLENLQRVTDKTLSGVIDLMPSPAILGALYDLAVEKTDVIPEPEHLVLYRIITAIENPSIYAKPNPRSKNGYGYGHHKAFPDVTLEDVLKVLPEEPVNINALTDLVILVADRTAPSKLDRSTIDDAVTDVAEHFRLTFPEEKGLRSSASLIDPEDLTNELVERVTSELASNPAGIDYINALNAITGATPMPKPTVAAISIDPNFADAISALLGKATDGAINDVTHTLNELVTLRSEKADLSSTIAKLNSKLAAAPKAIAMTGAVRVNADDLTYEVVMREAADLFPNPKTGKKLSQLKFEIPTLVWRDSDGTVVDHPDMEPLDPDYIFRAAHVLKLSVAWLKRKYVWAHGHSGSGKTTLHSQFFARIGLPVYRLNLDSSLERSDLVGQKELRSKDGATVTHWVDGILPRVMQNPGVLMLDEMDYGRADILAAIQRALEGKGLLLTEDGGRLVQPHELFVFAATANSRGQGDEWGVYPGIRPMNAALLDRFGAMVQVSYLSEDEELLLLKKTHPALEETFLTQLSTFAKLAREAFVNGEISTTLSPRGTLAICDFYGFFLGPMGSDQKAREMALEMVVIDKTTEDNKQRILELAARAFS